MRTWGTRLLSANLAYRLIAIPCDQGWSCEARPIRTSFARAGPSAALRFAQDDGGRESVLPPTLTPSGWGTPFLLLLTEKQILPLHFVRVRMTWVRGCLDFVVTSGLPVFVDLWQSWLAGNRYSILHG